MPAPTPKQVALIEKLSAEQSIEFVAPTTKAAASAAIESLLESGKALRAAKFAAAKVEKAEAMADTPPWRAGRTVVVGKFVGGCKVKMTNFGPQLKGKLVQDVTGREVWMTVPAALRTEQVVDGVWTEVGPAPDETVAIAITIKPSEDEPWFGFGSNPKVAPMPDTARKVA